MTDLYQLRRAGKDRIVFLEQLKAALIDSTREHKEALCGLSGYIDPLSALIMGTEFHFQIADYKFIVQSQLFCTAAAPIAAFCTYEYVTEYWRLGNMESRFIHLADIDVLMEKDGNIRIGETACRQEDFNRYLLRHYCEGLKGYLTALEQADISTVPVLAGIPTL